MSWQNNDIVAYSLLMRGYKALKRCVGFHQG